MIALSSERPRLQSKLKDMQVLYRGFEELKQDRFITAEELLDIFCQAAPGSATLRGCEIVFDGFTGFTPVQQKALEVILRLAARVRVAVTLDGREHWSGRLQEHELFSSAKRRYAYWRSWRSAQGLSWKNRWFWEMPRGVLDRVRGWRSWNISFFDMAGEMCGGKRRDPDISVHTALNPAAELRFASGAHDLQTDQGAGDSLP